LERDGDGGGNVFVGDTTSLRVAEETIQAINYNTMEIQRVYYHIHIHRAKWARDTKRQPATCRLVALLIHLPILGELNKIRFPVQQPFY